MQGRLIAGSSLIHSLSYQAFLSCERLWLAPKWAGYGNNGQTADRDNPQGTVVYKHVAVPSETNVTTDSIIVFCSYYSCCTPSKGFLPDCGAAGGRYHNQRRKYHIYQRNVLIDPVFAVCPFPHIVSCEL